MIEYFDRNSLAFLRQRFPETPENAGAALLIEQENGDIDFWADHAPEDSWFADNDKDRERFRKLPPRACPSWSTTPCGGAAL